MKRALSFCLLLGGVLLFFILRPVWQPRSPLSASNMAAGMTAANRLYEDEKYAGAVQAYEALIAEGADDAAVYFNLGNASYKRDQIGKAISAYRRAARLAPRDGDVQANLILARNRRVDKLEQEGGTQVLSGIAGMLTLDEWSLLALGSWFLLCLLLVWRMLTHPGSALREGLLYVLILCALVWAGSAFILGRRLIHERNQPDGVILAEEVEVTSAPGGGILQFTLHSGAEVSILEERLGWTRLALSGGKMQGWVPESALDCVDCE